MLLRVDLGHVKINFLSVKLMKSQLFIERSEC